MWIKKSEIVKLSADIRRIVDGRDVDLRDNREGVFSILKNDVHTLASLKNEQVNALRHDRDRLKDTLADISHQLKSPLTSMLLMADLLETAPPDRQDEFIANIRTGLTRMEWLASALLKLAKLDAGAVAFAREWTDASELIALALEPLQILLDVKNQRVAVAAGETRIFCDRRWTAEALSNVIKNASEYSPDGGEIRIESGEDPICVWIAVADCGKGLSASETVRLFRRFEGSRSEKGYGIGLPLALAVMRAQSGDIQAGGGENGGAVFTLKFYR
ncbi:MAG: HAMP domain-containing histidine kinase [Gracilibacteraceae bacterium]|nr:HAMP domain-containing histidine kinase [Gracilibacteraceae bacterium]